MQTGSALKQLPVGKLKELKIIYPSLPEQTAIATALSDTDALIENLEKLIAKKKAIKQGAMQQLLTGKKSLPGFSGEWEVKKLGEVCVLEKGSQINKSKLTEIGKYPVWNGGITPSGFTEKYNTPENTITISEGGNSCGFVNHSKEKLWCGGHCYAITNVIEKIDQLFYFQKLKFLENKIMGLRVGSGLPNIQKKNLYNLDLSFPSTKEEQTAIATVLSDMDTEIDALEKSLAKYQNIKTGMMQQLLTGKIRLLRK